MEAKRDWGYAKEYVEGMWMMMQQDEPADFVLATNETHTVRELAELTCQTLGMNLEWQGEGIEEQGIDLNTGKTIIRIDPEYFRPAEVDLLIGDYSKAKKEMGWEPKTTFKELIEIMTESDFKREKKKAGIS